ncbi:MAG: hypothetical protein K8S99_02640 [Planctomycetes bacterium]|nr:hypothetical protein [Planctomycetota bacterium]
MTLKAGFAEIDITPPIGTAKIGWLKVLTIDRIVDPLFAHAGVIESDRGRVGFIVLDTLSVRWSTVQEIRKGISKAHGFPGECVMVGATHNHGGPATSNTGEVKRDEKYTAGMVEKCVKVFGQALANRVQAQIGIGSGFEFNVAANRRVVLREGITRTHGHFPTDPRSLHVEGPIDPEVAVIAARSTDGKPLGAIINFACHPTHLGGTGDCTAGWPGALASEMKKLGWPVTLFLQGAAGEIHHSNPVTGVDVSMETAGRVIAEDAVRIIKEMKFRDALATIGARARTIQLPHRKASDEEIKGTLRGAQRFVDPTIYDRGMPALLERIRSRPMQPAEVQAVFLDDHAIVSIPAEYFCMLGLRIKEESYPKRTFVAAYANGMVGYVPSREAFKRGGYETTFAMSSRLAPEAGDMLADCAIEMVRAGL